MKPGLLLAVLLIWAIPSLAQPNAHEVTRRYRQTHEHKILNEFVQLLSIPNVASDTINIRKNATFILGMMSRRGLSPRLLEANDPTAPPAFMANGPHPALRER